MRKCSDGSSRRGLPSASLQLPRPMNGQNENGEFIRPTKPNAYKFETLILDMIYMMDDCLSFEVDRSKEFAPVKNATGVDSVESARELLTQNGIEI